MRHGCKLRIGAKPRLFRLVGRMNPVDHGLGGDEEVEGTVRVVRRCGEEFVIVAQLGKEVLRSLEDVSLDRKTITFRPNRELGRLPEMVERIYAASARCAIGPSRSSCLAMAHRSIFRYPERYHGHRGP